MFAKLKSNNKLLKNKVDHFYPFSAILSCWLFWFDPDKIQLNLLENYYYTNTM